MPNCTGVIAEYNPFHNGHRYQLSEARRVTGCEHVAVVMSGGFVQRGEVAMFDKFSRARWALESGADIVFLLPSVYSCARADRFAEGAVRILGGTGLADALCFGSESGDVSKIVRMAALVSEESDEQKECLRAHLKRGVSFPNARGKMLNERHGAHFSEVASLPNDILGIEYVRAVARFAPQLHPYAIKRVGAMHDAVQAEGSVASASALRKAVLENDRNALSACVPENVATDILEQLEEGRAPYVQERLSDAILYALRRMPREALSRLPDVSEGLENVLYRCAREAGSYEELLTLLKTKRYTLARLKRILCYALLGVEESLYASALPYIRVLGVKRSALPLLSQLASRATLPVVTRYADAAALPESAKRLHEIDMLAAELAPLALKTPARAAFDYGDPLILV